MEPDQSNPDISLTQSSETQSKRFNWKSWKSLLLLVLPTFVILWFVVLGFLLLRPARIGTTAKINLDNKTTVTAEHLPDSEKTIKPIFAQIQKRQLVDSIDNYGENGEFSFGFLNSSLVDNKSTARSNFLQAYAADEVKYPLIIYPLDKTKIAGFNIATGEKIILFDLSKNPKISIKNGTAINKVLFLNRAKKIIFQLQERLDDNPDNDQTIINNLEKYKVSVNIYDLKSKELTELVSSTGGGSHIPAWSDLNISPDEKYLFTFYNNQTIDPFPQVKTQPNASDATATYFFYDLNKKKLKEFKLDQKLSGPGTVVSSFDHDGSSVLLGFTKFPSVRTVFIQILPEGNSKTILDDGDGMNHYQKVYFDKEQNRIYYIGAISVHDTESVFGYYDISSNKFERITPDGYVSFNFIPDPINGGIIYDTFQYDSDDHSQRPSHCTIYYYDGKTGKSKEITKNDIAMLDFLGDYSHLLVGDLGGIYGSTLYDMDLATGTPMVLSSGPFIISPWARHGKFHSIQISPQLQKVIDEIKNSTNSGFIPNH